MNWEAIGAVGEILGALFVFASLLYLANQVRHNSRSTLSQSINTRAYQLQSLSALQANPALMAAMKAIYTQPKVKPSFEDAAMLEAYFTSALALAQAHYQHYQLGLESNWDVSRKMVAAHFATDYVKGWWAGMGAIIFEPQFVAEVNEIISEGYEGDFWTNYEK